MLSRRDFLSRLTVLSAGTLLPLRSFGDPVKPTPGKNRILVAGAGIAGLYAADMLEAQGFTVDILEASDRAGGKLMSGSIAGIPFDFGGQGFSKEMKRVESLGRRLGLTKIKRPEPGDFFLGDDGSLLTGDGYVKLHDERAALDQKAAALYPGLSDPAQRAAWGRVSLMDFAKDHFSPAGLAYFRTNFASEWCSLPEEVSLLHFLEMQKAFDGDEADEMAYRFREGFGALTDRLARRLSDRIQLNTPLESVRVYDRGVIATAGGRVFEARALVLAIPLPQVARIEFAGFDSGPLLNAVGAYRGCGVRKILAVYDKPFWGDKARDGEFALPVGMAMLDNSDVAKGAYCLAIFLGGPSATNGLSQEAVLTEVAKVVGPEALEPIGYHEQVWLDTEHLPGGYASNRVPSATGSGVLPTSISGRVFLAGSETADHFPTYVEGALGSAERAVGALTAALAQEFVLA